MKGYILSIAGIILISAVVTIVAPNGKMGKFVKGTVGLFILVVMISPLIGWMQKDAPAVEGETAIAEDESYLSKCAEMLAERDEEEIASSIAEQFGIRAEVEVRRAATAWFEREKITVKLDAEGINGEEERINIMTRIREALSVRYGCALEIG